MFHFQILPVVDEHNGLDDSVDEDTEARDLWLQYLPPERVIACSAKDNFWEVCHPAQRLHVHSRLAYVLLSIYSLCSYMYVGLIVETTRLAKQLDGRNWSVRTM